MASYRVVERSFINNTIAEEGEVVEYDGEAGPNLEPVKAERKKAAEPAEGSAALA